MLYGMTTSPIFGLRREIDRLFDDTFTRDGFNWTPAVDIKENDSEIRLDLELPGLKPEDVELTAENGVLTVRGEKKSQRKEGEDNRYHIVERSYGSFLRTFQLPQGIDEEQIKAEFENGVLGTLEGSQLARGRANSNAFEINCENGSIAFDMERAGFGPEIVGGV